MLNIVYPERGTGTTQEVVQNTDTKGVIESWAKWQRQVSNSVIRFLLFVFPYKGLQGV